ncbi:MAG: Asp-tRNA(Asn)/Glu-tRNA(Gln) amidotransferase subunit GatC [Candidatus Latescibacteria bacterium]|nr:Asp-tRNA(Asn)/Glu-tRNA(Gln) amidotransferase subunit GatC [Candidatus Latescibacterota bacterium]
MAVTKKDVENIAALARLSFSQEEKERLMSTLNGILEYFDKLSELDTENVEPLTHILPVQNVMRVDECTPSLSREKALANAPEKSRGHFVIPKVIE